MPILQVKALPQREPERIRGALSKVSVAIAETYGCEPKHVWTTWEEISPGYYFEGEVSADVQMAQTHPPICQLICFEGKSAQEIEKILLVTSRVLSTELGIENNIFVEYREVKSGRVVAGDGVVRRK